MPPPMCSHLVFRAVGYHVLGGTLLSDPRDALGAYEGTYIGMMDHNITAIARGLGGSAPRGGMQDKLSATPTQQIIAEADGP